jgi:hypothetical protein
MIALFRLAAFPAAALRFGNIRCEFDRQNRKTEGKTDPDAAPIGFSDILRSKIMYLRRAARDGQSTVRGIFFKIF